MQNFKTGIIITGDSKGGVKAVRATSDELKKLNATTKKSQKDIAGLKSGLVALAAGAFSLRSLSSSIDAYARQEQSIRQLEARLKSTQSAAGLTSQELQQMASSLQKVTTFGDEAVIEMQSLLLTFTQIRGGTFKQAQEAILNVSTALGQDLKSSALQVGKALNDPILGLTSLSRSGIQFSDDQRNTIKTMVEMGDVASAQAIILQELNTQFGGAARAAAEGTGILKQVANAWGDVSEQTGEAIITNELVQDVLKGTLGVANAMAGNTSIAEWAGETNVVLKSVAAAGETVSVAFENIGLSLGALAAAASFIIDGDFDKVGEVWRALKEDIEANNDELSEFFLNLSGVETKLKDLPQSADLNLSANIEERRNVALIKSPGKDDKKNNEFDQLVASLRTEEEVIQESYDRRLQIILDNTEQNSLKQIELIERLKEEFGSQAVGGFLSTDDSYEEELAKLTERYERRKELILENVNLTEEERAALEGELTEARNKKIEEIENKKNKTLLDNNEQLFGDLAGLAKAFAGEQSAVYKTLFAASKAYSLANVLLSSYDAIAKAWASAPFPANLPAVFTTVVETGALQAAVSAVQPSFMGGGFTGNGPRIGGVDGHGGFQAILHPNETVIDHTKKNGKYSPGEQVPITIINQGRDVDVVSDTISDGQRKIIIAEAVDQARQAVASDIVNGSSDVADALEGTYGTDRAVGARR